MPYEKFTAYGAGARDSCTLRASRYLFVPRSLCAAAGNSTPERVLLYFDSDAQRLAVVPYEPLIDDEDSAAREVSVEPSGIAVNLAPLMKVYGYAKPAKKMLLDSSVVAFNDRKAIEVEMRPVPRALGKFLAEQKW